MRFPVATLMIGVLSGLATAVAARFWSGLNAFVGLFFGIAVSFLVWRKYKRHSALLVTALLATSVASYCAAIWGTPYLFSTADRFLGWQNNFMEPFGPGTFAIAGFVGALIFNLALLLLLSPKGRLLLGKAAAWACAGALSVYLAPNWRNMLEQQSQPSWGFHGQTWEQTIITCLYIRLTWSGKPECVS